LAQAITADLRLISEDKHIFVDYNQPATQTTAPEPPVAEHYPSPSLTHTYSYKASSDVGWMGGTQSSFPYEMRSGLLEQNPKIGYLDLRIFGVCQENIDDLPMQQDVVARRKALINAVQNLQNAESIVIDLRNNGGGHPTAVQLLCSLFIEENRPLNRIEWRKGDGIETQDFNTLSYKELAPEKRLLKPRKVVVLIGPKTFSAAEEFTNNMKVLGRATIVGEPSGGGANPGGPHPIGKDFTIFIPEGRAVNPIQQGNWEGVGIIPDHVVPAKEAMGQALLLIS
jgi:C-terminal processing protease CtpA/Prc